MPEKKNDPKSPLNSDQIRQLLWLILVTITVVWIINAFITTPMQVKQIPYSEFKTIDKSTRPSTLSAAIRCWAKRPA